MQGEDAAFKEGDGQGRGEVPPAPLWAARLIGVHSLGLLHTGQSSSCLSMCVCVGGGVPEAAAGQQAEHPPRPPPGRGAHEEHVWGDGVVGVGGNTGTALQVGCIVGGVGGSHALWKLAYLVAPSGSGG